MTKRKAASVEGEYIFRSKLKTLVFMAGMLRDSIRKGANDEQKASRLQTAVQEMEPHLDSMLMKLEEMAAHLSKAIENEPAS
jgi:hypothetical protein